MVIGYGARIRELREERGIKQIFLARKIGTSPQRMSQIERQACPKLTLGEWYSIATALGVSMDELIPDQRAS